MFNVVLPSNYTLPLHSGGVCHHQTVEKLSKIQEIVKNKIALVLYDHWTNLKLHYIDQFELVKFIQYLM